MSINPKMWDDEHFIGMSVEARLMWCHLLTGYSGGIPGLILVGSASLADAMRYEVNVAERCLVELANSGFIEFDHGKRMLRIPAAPNYRRPGNTNVLKGWLRRWRDLPESALKYRHIESIRKATEGRKFYEEGWAETFATIEIPEHTRQVPLFRFETVKQKQVLTDTGNNNNDLNENIAIRNKDETVYGSLNPLNVTATETATVTETSTDTSTETATVPPSYEKPRVRDPLERHMAATELWRLQEELRSELAPGVKPRESTGAHLAPIMSALETYTQDELENSLKVESSRARNDPKKLQYFNGFNNWRPESLKRTTGQIVSAGTGHYGVSGRRNCKKGSAF